MKKGYVFKSVMIGGERVWLKVESVGERLAVGFGNLLHIISC